MSTWDSPEHEALDDAQSELHIAADRWADNSEDEDLQESLKEAVRVYRAARDAYVDLVAQSHTCPRCGHYHAGQLADRICIGCPCEERR